MSNNKPIGVFDSGIGGLTVAKRIMEFLPHEEVVYFGDTARVPYGSKSNETVIEYSKQDARFLMSKNVKFIVVACNTASSVALDELRKEFKIPIIGMIEPGALEALRVSKNNKIGVIGTNATINNKAYSKVLNELNQKVEVYEKACPLFVPLAEEGWTNHKATKLIAEEYLTELKDKEIDTLILGCTHYPILTDVISEVMGKDVNLIDSGFAAVKSVRELLRRNDFKNVDLNVNHRFYVSDIPTKFKEIAERFLGTEIQNICKVDVENIS